MCCQKFFRRVSTVIKNFFCKKPVDYEKIFFDACANCSEVNVKESMFKCGIAVLNGGLLSCSRSGYTNIIEILLKNIGYSKAILNSALGIACKNNRYSTAELLARNGADVVVGLRVSTSHNITTMLYNYENKVENKS